VTWESESGILWKERDRFGHEIYLTEERWRHIVEPTNHPEMEDCLQELRETIRLGRRRQDTLNPQKFRYSHRFENLPESNTHIVVIVLFRFRTIAEGVIIPNNYVVTAYQKVMQ
jgi:hypothetical protein